MPPELPLAAPDAAPHERADARRNRERILCAASRLIATRGLECVSMDDVAAEAGVGKGTLYRRFGDRSTLMRALIDADERGFQEAVIRGEPPLGPGAPPLERLHAFGDGLLALFERRADVIAAAESTLRSSRFDHEVYAFYRLHIGLLVGQILGAGDPRTRPFADTLAATLTADLFLHQRRRRGQPLDELREGWHLIVGHLIGAAEQVP